ncbi:MAG: hypothetical protein AAFY56_24540, partial [Pseudomonadota bacterium]
SQELNRILNAANDDEDSTVLYALNQRVQEIDNKIQQLNNIILDSPEKALSVPLLRNELESLQSDFRGDIVVARREIDRIYDMNKWLIGLMATMALSILGLAIGNFAKSG